MNDKFGILASAIAIGVAMLLFLPLHLQAGEVSVSGFTDLIYTITDDTDTDTTDTVGEKAFSMDGEVDFMADRDGVSARLDLDINKGGKDVSIEQIFFSVPIAMITVTGGKFNTLIGFEGPDAPGLLQTSYGQLGEPLGGVGALGLTGLMITGKMDMVTVDAFVKQADNDLGGQIRIAPMEGSTIAVGFVQAPDIVGGDMLDIYAIWTGSVLEGKLLAAFEYVDDDELSGWGIWVNDTYGPYGLTLRYDSVDCDAVVKICEAVDVTPTSLTVAASWAINDNLGTLLEWKTSDPDIADDPSTPTVDESESVDLITLEAIVTF